MRSRPRASSRRAQRSLDGAPLMDGARLGAAEPDHAADSQVRRYSIAAVLSGSRRARPGRARIRAAVHRAFPLRARI